MDRKIFGFGGRNLDGNMKSAEVYEIMFRKTHGRIYLICQQEAPTLHDLEYRIKFLSQVLHFSYSVMTLKMKLIHLLDNKTMKRHPELLLLPKKNYICLRKGRFLK